MEIENISVSIVINILFSVMVLKVCSADTKGSATSSQGIRGYIFLMAALKFTNFLITRMMFCLQFFNWRYVYFVQPLEYLIQKPSVLHEATNKQFNSRKSSANVLSCMLLVCISSYLKSFLRNKFLILDNCYPYSKFT